ncbi:MAG: hypothetical protein WC385_03145 [Candidatus Paceibacterota bacterium]|jgi:hypothetical protein
MANLLPNEIKQNLQRDLANRKLLAISLVVTLWLIIALVIIGSVWVNLFIRESGVADVSGAVNREVKEGIASVDQTFLLKKLGDQIKVVNGFWSEPLTSVMIAKALSPRPVGLKISGLVIERGELGKTIKLSLIGLASGRNELVNYVNLLRQDKFFTKVDLPVESLISDQGGQFTINLEK